MKKKYSRKQSLKGGSCIHFSPCKVSSSDKHNERTMLKQLNNNIDEDLTKTNREWRNSEVPNLKKYEQMIIQDYNQNQKEYIKKQANKRTGKVTEYTRKDKWKTNMHAIKEAVVLLPDDSHKSWVALSKVAKFVSKKYGLRILRAFQHNDEHRKDDDGKDKFNYHGHIVFDWYDPKAHRLRSLGSKDMEEIQDKVAEITGMPRGNKTGMKGLSNVEFKNNMEILDRAKEMKAVLMTEYETEISRLDSVYSNPNIQYDEEVEKILDEHEEESNEIFTFEPSPMHPVAFLNCLNRFSRNIEHVREITHRLEMEIRKDEIQSLEEKIERVQNEIGHLCNTVPNAMHTVRFLQEQRDMVFDAIQEILGDNGIIGELVGMERRQNKNGKYYEVLELQDESDNQITLNVYEQSGVILMTARGKTFERPSIPKLTKYLTAEITPEMRELLEEAYPLTEELKKKKLQIEEKREKGLSR